MDEEATRVKITELFNARLNRDIQFTFTPSKEATIESHIQWIKTRSNDGWDEQVALQRFYHLKSEMESDLS